jgi:septal ring factor EnvC (AmiA/AmiB activator)
VAEPQARRRSRPGAHGLALALLGIALWAGLGLGIARGGPNVVEREGELKSLRAQIEEKRRQIESLRRQGQNLERIVTELEREQSMTERYLAALRLQETALEQDLTTRQLDLAAKEQQIANVRRELGAALVHYYKQRRVTDAELLISSSTFGELFARGQYWARTVQNLRERLFQVRTTSDEIERELAVIRDRRAEMLGVKAEREQQMRRLVQEEASRRADRAQVDRKVERAEAQTRKLIEAQRRVEELISEARRARTPSAGTGPAVKRGRLPWPVKGDVTARFGTVVNPRFGTQVLQKGIEIAAPDGTPVRAVTGGRVIYAGWLEGYGNTVVLDHGNDFFTLYAHASQLLVRQGADVRAGSEIARVGSTDALGGPGLYFEVRQGAEAQDPLAWLE